MAKRTSQIKTGAAWINQIFVAAITSRNGLARRRKQSVERYSSFTTLEIAVKSRGFHLIETGEQYVIICNTGAFKIHF